MARNEMELYPDYTSEIEEIDKNGISLDILYKIISKHALNREYNKNLFNRYRTLDCYLPIFNRQPRYEVTKPINNRINNDFFSEIVDFKVGYFAGKPFSYSYSNTHESIEQTGGENAVEEANKAITDFVTRNNMFNVDMEVTKHASIYGYGARLFYHDIDGNERVMPVNGYEVIILSNTDISEPQYAVRYYSIVDIFGVAKWKVEFYDSKNIYYYEGSLSSLILIEVRPNLYDFCPLQGIPNNSEMMGDAEKVLELIDEYDRTVSNNSNEIENATTSKTVYENVNITDEEIDKSDVSGAIRFYSGASNGKVYYLEKNINDTFNQNHLERIEKNIYKFSKTPNLSEQSFYSASGISLKFKLTGLETKVAMFEAKFKSAAQFMFNLLSSSLNKKRIKINPLQCIIETKRNFPIDMLSEAQTAQALISAGLPKEWVYSQIANIDDVNYIMQLIEDEKENIPSLYLDTKEDLENEKENTTMETNKISQ